MQAFHQLFLFHLPIPVWQILLYVGLMSFFLIKHKVRLSLVTSYVFILFWLYYSFRGDLISVTREDFVAQTVYGLFGVVLVGLGMFAYFFLERGKEILLENLRKRNGEIADLKLKAKKAEKSARALMTQVAESQQSFHTQESALKKKLEGELNAEIGELEHRLEDRESLLEKRDGEIADFKLKAEEAEKRAHALKNQEQKDRQGSQVQDSNNKKSLEQELKNNILELKRLQEQVNHKDGLLGLMAKRNSELADLKSKADKRIEILEAQLKENQQVLHTEDSGNSYSNPDQNHRLRYT